MKLNPKNRNSLENSRDMPVTTESVLAVVKGMFAVSREETVQRNAEAVQRNVEATERSAKAEKEIEALRVFLDQVSKQAEDAVKSVKQVSQQMEGMCNSNGAFAEEFFYNAFLHGQKHMFGEGFGDVIREEKRRTKKGFEDECDIMLFNGRAVCIVEVKYKADSSDLPQQVLRKAQTFRANFPEHNDKTVYLALAGMSFNPLTEKACSDNGIAIIKQVGDAVVINDKHLKAF
jgi:hypothetical protein